LAHFAPAQAMSGGRVMTARALETIAPGDRCLDQGAQWRAASKRHGGRGFPALTAAGIAVRGTLGPNQIRDTGIDPWRELP